MLGVKIFIALVPLALALPHQQTRSVPSTQSNRIIGGTPATIEEIPYIVQVETDEHSNCGGSIISPYWVVTAGHCLEGLTAAHVNIRAGTDQFLSGGEIIYASDVYVHPNYDRPTLDYDIALIKLSKSLSFGSSISSISLKNGAVKAGTEAVASGWGFLDGGSNYTNPDQLQKVTLPVVKDEDCPDDDHTPRMLCAGYENGEEKNTCLGDSGGPLAVGNTLIGVVSAGYNCKGVSYFSNIDNLHSWISSITSI